MRVLIAAIALSLVAVPCLGAQTSSDLEAQRRVLAQPGPEARLEREAVIEALLSRPDPAAHELLRDIVRVGPDADDVVLTVLAQLRRKLGNPHDPVFGANGHERGLARGYVPALAALFAPRQPADDKTRAVREEARLCVVALSAADRRRAFEELLPTSDPELRRGAMMLAGSSRDLGLAPLLAKGLEAPDTAADAREALARLTFVDAFAGKQQFDQWWADHRQSSYLLLAEEAAQRARDNRTSALRRAESRITEVLAALVEALARQENPAWAAIAERTLADDPPGSMRVCLERLRDVLGKAPRLGGTQADRLALLQRLLGRLGEGSHVPEIRAVMLEVCAYLVAPGEDRPADDVAVLLREGLRHESAIVRRAAVLGLARYPSAEATRLLVRAGLAAAASGEQAVLTATLGSLAAQGRVMPDGDSETLTAWLGLIDGVLRDATLPEVVREAALGVLEAKGAKGKPMPQVFTVLTSVAKDRTQAPLVREKATVMMQAHAADDSTAAVTYVDTLIGLLTDPEKRMRLKAAQLLQSLPRHRDFPDVWRRQVIAAVGDVLAKESDEVVLRALISCLERQVDPEKPDLEPVIARLCLALEEMGRTGVNGGRRQLLVSALAGQAATQGLDTMQWVRAAETLLQLGERRELRNVIDRQQPLRLIERGGIGERPLRLALGTVVRTAQLKARDEPWTVREAEDVLGALKQLDAQPADAAHPEWALLRIEAALVAGQWDEALQRGKLELDGGKLELQDRERVRCWMLRAHLGKNELDQAARVFEGGTGAGDPATLAQLREEIGVAMLRNDRAKDALTWLVEAQRATAEGDPAYPRRLLRRLDAEARAEPGSQAAVLKRLLEREALFTGSEVAPELRAEFDKVKGRLSGKG